MGNMRLWRPERRITSLESTKGCAITDSLSIEPRFAAGISRRIVRAFFEHRHRQLKLLPG